MSEQLLSKAAELEARARSIEYNARYADGRAHAQDMERASELREEARRLRLAARTPEQVAADKASAAAVGERSDYSYEGLCNKAREMAAARSAQKVVA